MSFENVVPEEWQESLRKLLVTGEWDNDFLTYINKNTEVKQAVRNAAAESVQKSQAIVDALKSTTMTVDQVKTTAICADFANFIRYAIFKSRGDDALAENAVKTVKNINLNVDPPLNMDIKNEGGDVSCEMTLFDPKSRVRHILKIGISHLKALKM